MKFRVHYSVRNGKDDYRGAVEVNEMSSPVAASKVRKDLHAKFPHGVVQILKTKACFDEK